MLFGPRVDRERRNGPILPEEPINIMMAGKHSRIPWLTGINKDEGVLLAFGTSSVLMITHRITYSQKYEIFASYMPK